MNKHEAITINSLGVRVAEWKGWKRDFVALDSIIFYIIFGLYELQ